MNRKHYHCHYSACVGVVFLIHGAQCLMVSGRPLILLVRNFFQGSTMGDYAAIITVVFNWH